MTTAIATREPTTRSEMLSEQELVRLKIARRVNELTDDGDELIQFMLDTVRGEYPDAKFHHRQIAARDLAVMSGKLPEDTPGSSVRVVREKDTPKPTKKPKLTMKEIANWHIGRAIRSQSNDCLDLIEELRKFLDPPYVFPSANPDESKYQKATQVKAHHQVAAAQEMIKRLAGSRTPDCAVKTSSLEEKMLHSRLSRELREITGDGVELVTFLREVIRNPKFNAWKEIITDPYTQTHRLWALKHLIWRGADIPWEHITAEDIEEYYRRLDEKERQEQERRRAERQAAAQLTPEQEAEILALFEQINRENEQRQAKNAAKTQKQAQKAANKADAAKADAHDYNSNNADTGKSDGNANNAAKNKSADASNNASNGSAAKDIGAAADNTDTPTSLPDTPTTRGETAVANALARHPEVDLDTALQNHHSTAGIPKEDLTHEQIYDAITAEANFQKRQAIIQRRLHPETPDAPEDNDPPKSRSP